MKILFCTRGPLLKELGATKVILEVADSMQALGVDCTVRGRDEILSAGADPANFRNALKDHLLKHAHEFDVVDYDHEDLPFPRSEFPPHVLMVARSVLLAQHMESIRFPNRPGLKYALRRLVYGRKDKAQLQQRISRADTTIDSADLVNVGNREDKAELVRRGVPAAKIVVLPFGLSQARRSLLHQNSQAIPSGPPVVVFVGTFDYRKGAREIPDIWERVRKAVPGARLRLLGTAGLMQTEREVRSCFSTSANESIEVYPRFDSKLLPDYLAGCWAGIFPSWLEGFGFGVLEMLASAIPVVAYNAPGPPEMLAPENLVGPGDAKGVADRVIHWLTHRDELSAARSAARVRSKDFDWNQIAVDTKRIYESAIQIRQGRAS